MSQVEAIGNAGRQTLMGPNMSFSMCATCSGIRRGARRTRSRSGRRGVCSWARRDWCNRIRSRAARQQTGTARWTYRRRRKAKAKRSRIRVPMCRPRRRTTLRARGRRRRIRRRCLRRRRQCRWQRKIYRGPTRECCRSWSGRWRDCGQAQCAAEAPRGDNTTAGSEAGGAGEKHGNGSAEPCAGGRKNECIEGRGV